MRPCLTLLNFSYFVVTTVLLALSSVLLVREKMGDVGRDQDKNFVMERPCVGFITKST